MTNSSLRLRRIVLSALFLSAALVLKFAFSFKIPLFGESGMSVGISGIFSIMPAILFGPVYGMAVSAISDIIGYILKPSGAYMPLMTVIVGMGAFIRGSLWLLLKDKNRRSMQSAVIIVSACFLLLGLSNVLFLSSDGVNSRYYEQAETERTSRDDMHLISRMLIDRTADAKNPGESLSSYITTVTAGLMGCAALGFVLLIADRFIKKSHAMPLLIAMLLSGLTVTTLNTILLRETVYASWKLLPFSLVWLPRVIQEILSNTVMTYFIAVLFGVFENQKSLKSSIC